MENKSLGQILYEKDAEFLRSRKLPFFDNPWEAMGDEDKERLEFCANGLIQYYEEYILDNFLNKYKPEEK